MYNSDWTLEYRASVDHLSTKRICSCPQFLAAVFRRHEDRGQLALPVWQLLLVPTDPLIQGTRNGQATALALTLVGLILCPLVETSLFWDLVPPGSQNLKLQGQKAYIPQVGYCEVVTTISTPCFPDLSFLTFTY